MEHWLETQLAPPGETVQLMPPLIFEACFWFVFNRKVLFMKSVINFGIGIKRVGWSRFGSGALGGDQTGSARRNSAGNTTPNCLI